MSIIYTNAYRTELIFEFWFMHFALFLFTYDTFNCNLNVLVESKIYAYNKIWKYIISTIKIICSLKAH